VPFTLDVLLENTGQQTK